jgi:UDPglucose 6-dehydrogenase
MKLTVIGTGYVGLVTGACFSEMGTHVICVDTDKKKIDGLKHGMMPIYEPGLEAIVTQNYQQGRLVFSTSLAEAVRETDIFFIAVGTPPGEDGSADLSHVLAVARELGTLIERPAVIVDKSTVPVGTADKVRDAVKAELDKRGVMVEFDVVSNPEFLKEGAAVEDFMKPDRVIIGADSERARKVLHDLYTPFTRSHERMIYMSVRAAEMTKYAANAILATKISFINEIAVLCDRMGVDVESVRIGIGSDSRIGYSFIYPGCGYGGSCFPKDVKALIHMAEDIGVDPSLLKAVQERNEAQKHVLFEKIVSHYGTNLRGKTFAVWGLAFKPGTDDMREAPSKVLLKALIDAGAKVRGFDPVSSEVARRELPDEWFDTGALVLTDHQDYALEGADALVLVTEWKSFRFPDFERIKAMTKDAAIFDGRNQYDPQALKEMGITYFGIGRGQNR